MRELKNAVERAYIMSEHELQLQPMNLHASGSDSETAHVDADGISVPISGSSLAEAEQWLIEATLAHWAGNKNRAAKTLGCSLKTFRANKLAIYGQQHQGMETHA